ncbi:dTMP kinase [Sphaerimonospora mesophila]|uniref:dTMP kinase n=1 Tax=Sphaerimonospora mesophila TaxID=37483 RepID=UPI0006E287C9
MSTPGRSGARRKTPHMLANVPYRRLWTAASVHGLGDWLNIIALTALAGNLTAGSGYQAQSLAVAGVFAAKLLPSILFGPLAGALAGRFDQRATMAMADLLRFVVVLTIPFVGGYQWLIIATVLVECVNLFWASAKDATLSGLVPKERAGEADRLNLLAVYGTAPIAAALFAIVSAVVGVIATAARTTSLRATDIALGGGALAYLVAGILIFTLRTVPGDRARHVPTPSVFRLIADGRRRIGRAPAARGMVTGMMATLAAGAAVVGVARPYVQALHGGDAGYGAVFCALFLGVGYGMVFGPRLLPGLSRRRLFGLAIVVAGLTSAAAALIQNLVIVVVLTAVIGACAGVAWIIGYPALDLETGDGPDVRHSRTTPFLQSLGRVVLLLVLAVAGALAAVVGSHPVSVGGGADGGLGYRFDGANVVLLVAALLVVVAGLRVLKRLDDRRGVPLRADLLAALRGEKYAPEATAATESTGLFVAFEGGDGSGKTTQSRLLAIWLRDQGFDVVQTREPGATKVGMRLRAILLDAAHQGLSARAEAMLYAADRAEHVEKVIRPALLRGTTVISDRYVDSSLAYQGAGRALDPDDVARINAWATGGLVPDLTVLVDVPPSVGLRRMASPADRIEAEPMDFHERVRREFRALAAADPDRYLVVDGTLPQQEISRLIQDRVREIMPDPVPHEAEATTGTMPAIRD